MTIPGLNLLFSDAPTPETLENPSPRFTAVESFIERQLYDQADVDSDGVMWIRIAERSVTHVRLCGRMWILEGTIHAFWFDLERDTSSEGPITWTLYYDVDPARIGPRRARNAVDAIQGPDEVEWLVTLTGRD